ncbi:hypothetical protein [Curtobacterium oceanosedimentum]|nr:hypothetical protein [Curtobacterium oceanosedimentum]
MLLTEHDLDSDVSRLQGRRAWVRARAVVVFERSRPLEGSRLRVALVATLVGLPLVTTGLSEMVSPSQSAAEVPGRFALMTTGAGLSGIAVFAMLALVLSRQVFSGVIVSLTVVSMIILAWDVTFYDSDGGTVRSVGRLAQLGLAYPMLAVSMPLIAFGFASGVEGPSRSGSGVCSPLFRAPGTPTSIKSEICESQLATRTSEQLCDRSSLDGACSARLCVLCRESI